MKKRQAIGQYLNELWGVGARHALFGRRGEWYGQLKAFPGALFDPHGYLLFETEDDYRDCTYIRIGKETNVPQGISSVPNYVKAKPVQKSISDAALQDPQVEFDPQTAGEDARTRISRSIVQRQGQPEFRSKLLKIYDGKCCITECDVLQALEAAHIQPYRGPRTNHPSNGLLLRADLHALFDQGLFSIDVETMSIVLAPTLSGTTYGKLTGVAIRIPKKKSDHPSKDALNWHRNEHGL